MDLQQFKLDDDTADRQIHSINSLLYDVRTRYEQSARYMLTECGGSLQTDCTFPHGSGGSYTMLTADRIEYGSNDRTVRVITADGSVIPFHELMTDVQDLFVSHLHVHHSTERLMKHFA
ncbi:MAG: hypothetical protein ACOC2H_02505 [Spirochaetota bacterium]